MALNLYVWEGEGVLDVYEPGMVCTLAHSEDEAWALLYKKDSEACLSLQGSPLDKQLKTVADLDNDYPCHFPAEKIRPKIVTEPDAFVCWGST